MCVSCRRKNYLLSIPCKSCRRRSKTNTWAKRLFSSSSGKYRQAGFGMTQGHESNIEHGTQSDTMGVKSSLGLHGALCACVHQCVYARVSDSSRTRTGLGALCKRGPRHRTFVHVLARHRHSTAVDGDAAQAYWCASGLQEQNWRVTYKRENH